MVCFRGLRITAYPLTLNQECFDAFINTDICYALSKKDRFTLRKAS